VKAGRSEGPKNQETDQLEELWKAEREVSRNSLGASQEHTSETAQGGESKAVDLLEGTDRGEASPHQTRYSAEVLNEMTMEEVLAASFHGRTQRDTAAGFNRRMRKTACPVVWEGHGAQSPRPDPIFRCR
jgi:hypothetical protein